ncbi:MAG: DNRLRE domain-containing protein [Planctomycetes bacterium]|nr:DNRLRE domain-containing protein [Planctomycetota bacterium]
MRLQPPRLPLAFVALALATATTAQTTVVVPCAKDNTLYESTTGSLSSGSGPSLFVGVTGQPGLRRALLKFDIAAHVPSGARIVGATLTINTTQSAYAGAVDVSGHRVLTAWGEGASIAPGGGGGGGAAATNDATWLHTFYPGSFWSTAGGDFAPTPSLLITTQPFGLASSQPSTAMIADVQSWLNNSAGNHGWLLKTNEALPYVTRKFDSRETTLGTAPSLSVSYLTRGQTGTVGDGCLVGTQNFTHTLTGPFIGGTTVNLVQSNGPRNSFCLNMLALSFVPAGAQVIPGCMMYLPLGTQLVSHSVVLLGPNGAGSTPLSLPAGFPNVAIYSQAAALLPASPGSFVLSNAAIGILQ